MLRWMEMSAFSDVIFRTHPGNLPNNSAQVWDDVDSLAHFAKFSRVHSALYPYRKTLMDEALATGAPLTRHAWLCFPSDTDASLQVGELPTQFLLGCDLLVAPVLDKGADIVAVNFPGSKSGALWENVRGPI